MDCRRGYGCGAAVGVASGIAEEGEDVWGT